MADVNEQDVGIGAGNGELYFDSDSSSYAAGGDSRQYLDDIYEDIEEDLRLTSDSEYDRNLNGIPDDEERQLFIEKRAQERRERLKMQARQSAYNDEFFRAAKVNGSGILRPSRKFDIRAPQVSGRGYNYRVGDASFDYIIYYNFPNIDPDRDRKGHYLSLRRNLIRVRENIKDLYAHLDIPQEQKTKALQEMALEIGGGMWRDSYFHRAFPVQIMMALGAPIINPAMAFMKGFFRQPEAPQVDLSPRPIPFHIFDLINFPIFNNAPHFDLRKAADPLSGTRYMYEFLYSRQFSHRELFPAPLRQSYRNWMLPPGNLEFIGYHLIEDSPVTQDEIDIHAEEVDRDQTLQEQLDEQVTKNQELEKQLAEQLKVTQQIKNNELPNDYQDYRNKPLPNPDPQRSYNMPVPENLTHYKQIEVNDFIGSPDSTQTLYNYKNINNNRDYSNFLPENNFQNNQEEQRDPHYYYLPLPDMFSRNDPYQQNYDHNNAQVRFNNVDYGLDISQSGNNDFANNSNSGGGGNIAGSNNEEERYQLNNAQQFAGNMGNANNGAANNQSEKYNEMNAALATSQQAQNQFARGQDKSLELEIRDISTDPETEVGKLMVQMGYITEEQLAEALQIQRDHFQNMHDFGEEMETPRIGIILSDIMGIVNYKNVQSALLLQASNRLTQSAKRNYIPVSEMAVSEKDRAEELGRYILDNMRAEVNDYDDTHKLDHRVRGEEKYRGLVSTIQAVERMAWLLDESIEAISGFEGQPYVSAEVVDAHQSVGKLAYIAKLEALEIMEEQGNPAAEQIRMEIARMPKEWTENITIADKKGLIDKLASGVDNACEEMLKRARHASRMHRAMAHRMSIEQLDEVGQIKNRWVQLQKDTAQDVTKSEMAINQISQKTNPENANMVKEQVGGMDIDSLANMVDRGNLVSNDIQLGHIGGEDVVTTSFADNNRKFVEERQKNGMQNAKFADMIRSGSNLPRSVNAAVKPEDMEQTISK